MEMSDRRFLKAITFRDFFRNIIKSIKIYQLSLFVSSCSSAVVAHWSRHPKFKGLSRPFVAATEKGNDQKTFIPLKISFEKLQIGFECPNDCATAAMP